MNLEGQFVPTREPSFLDSLGKDNPLPRNPRTENSLSVSPPHLPSVPTPFAPRRGFAFLPHPGVISPRSYRASAPVHRSRNCCPSSLLLPRGAGMPRSEMKTAREPACWKPAARRKRLSVDINYNSVHLCEAS